MANENTRIYIKEGDHKLAVGDDNRTIDSAVIYAARGFHEIDGFRHLAGRYDANSLPVTVVRTGCSVMHERLEQQGYTLAYTPEKRQPTLEYFEGDF